MENNKQSEIKIKMLEFYINQQKSFLNIQDNLSKELMEYQEDNTRKTQTTKAIKRLVEIELQLKYLCEDYLFDK